MVEPDERTIPDIVEQAANLFGSAQALVDGEIDWSFNDLHFHVRKMARA